MHKTLFLISAEEDDKVRSHTLVCTFKRVLGSGHAVLIRDSRFEFQMPPGSLDTH
jgi:hypothetical protein